MKNTKAAAVFFDGPFPQISKRTGEEFPVWKVFIGDEDGEPIDPKKVYTSPRYGTMYRLAEDMASDRGLELVIDASAYA